MITVKTTKRYLNRIINSEHFTLTSEGTNDLTPKGDRYCWDDVYTYEFNDADFLIWMEENKFEINVDTNMIERKSIYHDTESNEAIPRVKQYAKLNI